MLLGTFDDLGRPRIGALVRIPGLAFRREVLFLVDTGSSTTALNVDDLRGLDLSRLEPKEQVGRGYGGVLMGYSGLALVDFVEEAVGSHGYQVGLLLFDDPVLSGLPSVLGRDVIQRWRMIHDPTNGLLQLEVWTADRFHSAG